MSIPDLVAHRGYALHYPENTLVAIQAALKTGVRYIEIDVQLTSDRVPVLLHDRTLQRMCGWQRAVHNYDWATLRTAQASEYGRFGYKFVHNPLASLADFVQALSAHPNVTAFIEVKRVAIEQFGIETVLNIIAPILAPIATRCVLISFSLELLHNARLRMRGAATGPAAWAAIGVVFDFWRERRHPLVRAIEPEYLFCDRDGLPPWGSLRHGETKVVIYEVADAAIALKLARRGVQLVETFACGELRQALDVGV